jgi:hypothetical protein
MDADTLLSEWHDNNHRPQWVVDARDQLMAYCDLSEPIPRRKSELSAYLSRYKSTITKQLQDAAEPEGESDEDGETTNTNGDGD